MQRQADVARWEPGKRDPHRYEGAMVRRGPFDLVRVKSAGMGRSHSDHPGFHRAATPAGDWALYDRRADPRQERDLAADHPTLLNEMIMEYERWWGAAAASSFMRSHDSSNAVLLCPRPPAGRGKDFWTACESGGK